MTYLLSIQLVVAAIQIYLVWRLLGAFDVMRRFDERLGHFGEALTLLTETAETGFVTMGQELERQRALGASRRVEAPARPAAPVPPSEPPPAVVADDAITISPGEVRVRLHLADKVAKGRAATRVRQERKTDGFVRR